MVPAAAAARQISAAWSRAIRSPSPGQRLADGGELDRDLGPVVLGQARVGQLAQQVEVGVGRGPGLGQVERVLAEVVEGDQPAAGDERVGGPDPVGRVRAGDVASDDAPAHRCGLDQVADPVALGQLQESLAQHRARLRRAGVAGLRSGSPGFAVTS